MNLPHILKRSFRVCFDFDGSKFVSSGDLLLVKYFIHQLSNCEFIQLRKCQRGVFQNHGVCGQAFPFLAFPPLPAASISVALAPIFAQPKSKKRLQRAESPTETLATQANLFLNETALSRRHHDVTSGRQFRKFKMLYFKQKG